MYGHAGIVNYLLNHGARVSPVDMGGNTMLHVAVQRGRYEAVVRLLKNQRVNPNSSNEHGNTPLHYACFFNYKKIAELLVRTGANVTILNKNNESPLDRAKPELAAHLRDLARQLGQGLDPVPFTSGPRVKKSEYQEFKTRLVETEIKQVSMSIKLGSGPLGETWMGSWSGHTVVARRLKPKKGIPQQRLDDLGREYMRLRIFSHDNLLPMLAVALEPNVYLIGLYMKLGSLYHVLHSEDSELKVDLKLGAKFARGICHGMAYLHSLDPLIPHLDLNPHHVFIDEDLTARINLCNTRLSFMENDKVYRPNWNAPETLQYQESDYDKRAADMYSFAIILWELLTGEVPYGGLPVMKVGIKIARGAARPGIPKNSNHHFARIIQICWNADPNKRPKFSDILPILDRVNV